jgi:pimeloyl-ACP methyl ester carboxylesterase
LRGSSALPGRRYRRCSHADEHADEPRRPRKNPPPRHALRAQFQASGCYDATARLGEISQPTLIVHGRADRIAPLALARETHNAIRGSRLALLGGGHRISLLPHRQRQFLAAVLAFLPPSKPPTAA